jgi:hypothetical protein
MLAVLGERKKEHLNVRPLALDHPSERNAVQFIRPEIDTGDQHADVGNGFEGIQCRHRVVKPDCRDAGGDQRSNRQFRVGVSS